MAQHSAAVVVFEQRSEHLGAHLHLPPQRHVGSNHFIVCVQVVTGRETEINTELSSYVDRSVLMLTLKQKN